MNGSHARQLWAADNLEVLATLPTGGVDLVYLDPPFNSGRTYDAFVGTGRHAGVAHKTDGFCDQWVWTDAAEHLAPRLGDFVNERSAQLLRDLAGTLGRSDLAAYLVMMGARLGELHRVLSDTGSLYLHCDPAASHYLKVVLDSVFGPEHFRSEIVWKRTYAHSSSRRYGPVHDVILFYSKTAEYVWNPVFAQYQASYLERHFTHEDERGRFQLITCTAPGDRTGTRAHYEWHGHFPPPGRHWAWKREQMEEFERRGRILHSPNGVPRFKRYTDDGRGVSLQDLWTDINNLAAHADERVGYETQKPVALIERLLAASTTVDAVVLDPFVGSGTALVAAERMGRQWIGIDSSLLACSISLGRVRQEIQRGSIALHGFPEHERSATKLLGDDPLTFGIWGTSMLGTLADRLAVDANLATGAGTLAVGHSRVQVLSWVPLNRSAVATMPRVRSTRGTRYGFLLRTGKPIPKLKPWLEQRSGASIHEVELRHLVDQSTISHGLAQQVVAIASQSAEK